jgi:4-aminobutyrate aminotransferase
VVLDLLQSEGLLENSAEVGAYLLAGLREGIQRAGIEAEARGTGLMIGVEILDGAGAPDPARARAVVEAAWRRGLLVLAPIGLAKNVVRVSPPLVLTREQAAEGIAILGEAFAEAA